MIDDQASIPTASVHTEIAILGAMLLDSIAIADATAKLKAEDFSLDSHMRIYRCIVDMLARNLHVDTSTVFAELQRKKEIESIGGPGYLAYLCEGIPRNFNIQSYVQIVKDKSLLRQMQTIFYSGIEEAKDHTIEPNEILDRVETQLSELSRQSVTGKFVSAAEVINAHKTLDEFFSGSTTVGTIGTGFAIDRWTNKFKPAQLIIVGARPAMGKTAWALNVAAHAAIRDRKHVGVFSLEMEKEALVRRIIQSESRIPKSHFERGLNKEERGKAAQVVESLLESPLFIEDTAFTTLQNIRAKARRLMSDRGLDLLIIDYLGLIEPPGKSENRTQEVSAMSRGLKGLAKELQIPIIALAQLNRECEKRQDKRPQLSDLRDSGSIEQDADLVGFLYRHEVYEPDNAEARGMAEFNLAKHRDGRIGVQLMTYTGDITRFEDRAFGTEEYPNYG